MFKGLKSLKVRFGFLEFGRKGGKRMADNQFLVDYMSRTYSRYLQSQVAGTSTKGVMGFREMVSAVEEKNRVDGISTKDMTLAEYKQYIYNRISQLPMHPSQMMRSVAVHISDEGFEAMRQDPEYEKWVLDTLKYDFAYNDPWAQVCGGSYAIHRFGASREDYRGVGWYTGFRGGRGGSLFEQEAEESFWDKRIKRHKKYMKLQQKAVEKEKIMERVFEEAAIRRQDFDGLLDAKGLAQAIDFASLLLRLDKVDA